MKKHYVFCYGTLKRGHGNHRIIANARFVGQAVTEPRFTMLGLGGFPGIVDGGETPISGELYEVTDDTMMERLDRLEGHPGFYCRTPIRVRLDGSDDYIDAEAYLLPPSWLERNTRTISSGIWG